MNERVRRCDALEILAFRPADDRNDAEVERAPELLRDVIGARLRFEGQVEFRAAQIRSLAGRSPAAAFRRQFFGLERQTFVLADAFAERSDRIKLAQKTKILQPFLRRTIRDEPAGEAKRREEKTDRWRTSRSNVDRYHTA